MRKLTILLAVLALAAMPSVADAAKKKHHHAAAKPAPAAPAATAPSPLAPAASVVGGFFHQVSLIPEQGKKK